MSTAACSASCYAVEAGAHVACRHGCMWHVACNHIGAITHACALMMRCNESWLMCANPQGPRLRRLMERQRPIAIVLEHRPQRPHLCCYRSQRITGPSVLKVPACYRSQRVKGPSVLQVPQHAHEPTTDGHSMGSITYTTWPIATSWFQPLASGVCAPRLAIGP